MKIGKTIKSIRTERGLKQKDLAAKLSMTAEFLSKIENNEKKPSWPTLSEIADALDVTVPFILLSSISADDIKAGEKQNFLKMKHGLEMLLNDIEATTRNTKQ